MRQKSVSSKSCKVINKKISIDISAGVLLIVVVDTIQLRYY